MEPYAAGALALLTTRRILLSVLLSASMSIHLYRCALRMTRTGYLHPFLIRSFRPPHIVRFSTRIPVSSATQAAPMNQHFSVDPEGKQAVDLTFASEALGMPAADGYGWAQFEFGDRIGQHNRYTNFSEIRLGACTQALGSLAIACQ